MKENKARGIAIIITIILGICVVIYLGGLLGELIAGYQKWLAEDGLLSGVSMEPVRFDPLYCISNAFTKDGLIGILIITAAAAAIFIYVKMGNKNTDVDDRNFTRSKKGTYGTAGWMTPKEMKSVLEIATPKDAEGIILGQKDGSVICLPKDTRLNKHLCVFGASGTMKSRAIVRPYLFQSIKRGDSVIVTDPKGELYNDVAEMFRRNGYTVRVFNLVNPTHSDSWNCMADLNGDTMMAQILTNVIISNTGKGNPDHFWDNGEGNLLKSLILYIDQDPTRSPDAKHLPAVYQMLTQNDEKTLSAIFDRLPISHPAKAPYNLFAQASDTVRAGIVLGLGTRLQVLQNDSIRNITSKDELDLTEPGKNKCAYFVILSDQESSTEFISSLFFSFLFIKLARYADSTPEQRCKVPVNIVFEELNNVGQLDTYPRRLSVVRSRAIQVCHVVQSLAQFKNRYPDEQWAEIVGNCDTQIMLGCTEEQTAEYFSLRSGDMTVDVNSTMTVRQTMAITQMTPQYRSTEGLGKRRLLTQDEVFRIPNTEMLIILRGEKVLRAHKFDYTGHPYSKQMVKTSIFDYYPQDKTKPPQTETETISKPESQQPELYHTDLKETVPKTTHAGKPPNQRKIEKNPQFCHTESPKKTAGANRRTGFHKLLDLFGVSTRRPMRRQSNASHPTSGISPTSKIHASRPKKADTGRQNSSLVPQTETKNAPETLSPPNLHSSQNISPQTDINPVLDTSTKQTIPPFSDNPDTETLLADSQTETEETLKMDSSAQTGEINCQTDTKLPHERGLESSSVRNDDAQRTQKRGYSQTETEKPQKKTDRRAKKQQPAPDYSQLMESFKRESGNNSKQSKKTPPEKIVSPQEYENQYDKESSGVPPGNSAALQNPAEKLQPSLISDLQDVQEAAPNPVLYGEAKPPDDF